MDKKIDFKQEMRGNAEIVTEELSVLERIFYQLKKPLVDKWIVPYLEKSLLHHQTKWIEQLIGKLWPLKPYFWRFLIRTIKTENHDRPIHIVGSLI